MSDTNTNDSVSALQEEDAAPDDVSEPTEKVVPKVSIRLAEARIARGMRRKDIAERLFLNVGYIKCIDEGDFETIKKPAFLKGYLRSYARELGLSGDEIVAIYEAELQESTDETSRLMGVTEQMVGSSNFTGPVATTGTYTLIGIVSIVIAIWWFSPEPETLVVTSTPDQLNLPGNERDDLSDPISAEYPRDAMVNEVARENEPGTTEATSSVDSTDNIDEQLVAGRTPFDIEARSSALDRAEFSSAAIETTVVESAGEMTGPAEGTYADQFEVLVNRSDDLELQLISVAAGGDDHLHFVFTDDCWLEIEDASGNLIYGDLNHDKDVLDIYGIAPFKLLIGNVSAVAVAYNDRTVNFEGNTFNDTAKLVIE